MKGYKAALIVICIIVADQVLKIWVKTHMFLGQSFDITSWFRIHFTENPGMAFGMILPGIWGKLFLSLFRLIAVTGGIWYLRKIIIEKAHWGFVTAVALILAGAIGNMIDGTFYGVIFSDSEMGIAKLFPAGGGYAGWMRGLVVDMLYFPLWEGTFPKWVPFWGGQHFEFFRFVFNIADSSITVGVFIILFFQRVFFKAQASPVAETDNTAPTTEAYEVPAL